MMRKAQNQRKMKTGTTMTIHQIATKLVQKSSVIYVGLGSITNGRLQAVYDADWPESWSAWDICDG
jgi:hypothetical protein